DAAQRREFGGGLGIAEDVERPVAHGCSPQVWVVESLAVVGDDGQRRQPGSALLGPAQLPLGLDSAVDTPYARHAPLTRPAEQIRVGLVENLARVWLEQFHRGGEQHLLFGPAARAAVGAVAKIGKMTQQRVERWLRMGGVVHAIVLFRRFFGLSPI